MIETNRLRLIRFDESMFQALFTNDMELLGALLDVETPDRWSTFPDMQEALPFFYEAFKENGAYWGSFFTIHKADRRLLGTCGYKFPPTAEGMTEIGYEIHADYRRQGLATEAADALMRFAFQHDIVKTVRAHTLAVANPSVLVLKKLNFTFIGTFNDPDDGDIWRWEKQK
jgi:[ribosomal protein S5]-alanine N-acetyltransferase